jgi:hypothetical protein
MRLLRRKSENVRDGASHTDALNHQNGEIEAAATRLIAC